MERGALIFRVSYGARSGESGIGRSAERRFKKGRSVERRCKKGSERGAEAKHGARSDDVKKGRSVERRCKKGSERGAEFTPGPPPEILVRKSFLPRLLTISFLFDFT